MIDVLAHFIAGRLRRALSSAPALMPVPRFHLALAVRTEGGDLDHGVVAVRDGQVAVVPLAELDTRGPYASLQLSAQQAQELLRGASITPELAFETAPLLAMMATALQGTGGVSPWQTRL